ncbi:acyl-CoA-binding domain-containing protein 3-like isoform X1 [Raphanus sativus]|uniref:Acyl-CoA-binding domain-containing protein 3-like isoform X1 n=1 Tax=Raphanus sativus TaxID=3726 RepID=A0A6J0MZ44_RAPSA|nr:acyl-CoA-binding domain-containing protein 3-like isoform X1 [Raphanus sativus]
MEFFLEMLLTAVVALLFSFVVAKLVTVSMAGNSDRSSDQAEETENGVVAVEEEEEELCSGLKMDAPVVQSERRLLVVVEENAELVDGFGREADGVVDEFEETGKEEDLVVTSDESSAGVSPENVINEEMMVCGEDKQRDSVEELIVRTVGAESTASVSLENLRAEEIMIRGQEVGSSEVVVSECEEVRVEESNTVEESEHEMELDTIGEKEELSIEEEEDDDDDDWEGIERSELEKAFATTSNLLEESGKAEEIGDEAKMELYGLHKIATEGSCRETQPMAIMVSARAKWNAWQKLGNMSQEEAMEKYLALVSKEIPDLLNNLGKLPETETSVVLPPNSGSLEDPATVETTGVESIKNVSPER